MNDAASSIEPLLGFRLAYLRAVARSWRDPAFRDTLLGKTDIQDLLGREFGMPWMWPKLNVQLYQAPNAADQTQWVPELTGGWRGRDDQFLITLPKRPDTGATDALAAYYQEFPDFMGNAVPYKPQTTALMGAVDTGLGIPDGGPGTLLAFGGVVLRAVALAWKSDLFMSELTDPTQDDATPVLSQWLGYNNPFNFQLRFRSSDAFTWNADAGTWNTVKSTIVLNYPAKPPQDETLWPIALTSYNNTGSAYPFTC